MVVRTQTMVLLGLMGALSACVPMKAERWTDMPVRQNELPADSGERIKLGEFVTANTRDGQKVLVQVVRLGATGFVGVSESDQLLTFEFEDLRRVRAVRTRWGVELLNPIQLRP